MGKLRQFIETQPLQTYREPAVEAEAASLGAAAPEQVRETLGKALSMSVGLSEPTESRAKTEEKAPEVESPKPRRLG